MLCLPPQLQAEVLHLTSLHWPPYSSQNLANQGAAVAVVRAAVEAMGHELEVDFYPWSRAIKLANMPNAQYVGYFPEYGFKTDKYLFSSSLGSSPLGLVEQKLHPISWVQLRDLNQYTLGVVRDYVNTEELDAMISAGVQKVEFSSSDEHNVRKVAAARVDAAVIDVHVLNYILKQGGFEGLASRLQVNRRLLADKQLYIAFQNSAQGRRWRAITDAGLQKIDVAKILHDNLGQTP
ncbi:transporter substrate-binding domain-containing protein [Shewanella sp. AS16]|uniref:transporter substrate-binding domain-containing protein n=1 Tax=Shewanella sp. AS16 TaxID=2907625 RepID=UPI001F377A2A|nr:transporter substrate-binding domain-containing protein [Shewanella sp. AS16]MCE9688236.1 transporter substrate-binding domain-containing protein [Shewanella sp. AS16]